MLATTITAARMGGLSVTGVLMVTMGKGEFKAYILNVIEHLNERSPEYERFCNIFLIMCGVVDFNGNLSEEYKCSPYWCGGEGGVPLKASANAELVAQLSDNIQAAINELDA